MNKTSPLKTAKLHRTAGQALSEKILELSLDALVPHLILPFSIAFGVLIGVLSGLASPWLPWISFAIFIIWGLVGLRLFFIKKPKIDNYVLGRNGEQMVGQVLDDCKRLGWYVLHDLQTGKGNIDHIIISPQGLFTIETKAVSRYEDEADTIFYDCSKVWTSKREIDSPLRQAKGEAKWLSDYIKRKLTLNIFVQPIVNYPGWNYEYRGHKTLDECDVWVCLTKGLPTIIKTRNSKLKPHEMAQIYNFLASDNRCR